MNDGGAIILIVLGLITSLQPISISIIEPYIKNKKGEKTKYSKMKIFFTVCYVFFFLILLVLDCLGVFIVD